MLLLDVSLVESGILVLHLIDVSSSDFHHVSTLLKMLEKRQTALGNEQQMLPGLRRLTQLKRISQIVTEDVPGVSDD